MSQPLSLEGVLFDPPREGRVSLTAAQGEVPAALRGSYYLNGPARLQRGDFRYRHWLDGDGFVRAVHFRDGAAELVSRFVRTTKFNEEKEADAPIYRTFGTSFADDRLRKGRLLESPANVSVFPFGGKLLAFGEQALPWELHPESLETIGEFDFKGALGQTAPFSAHPKIDEDAGRLCNFGLDYLFRSTVLRYWEFDQDFNQVLSRKFECPRPSSIHDFALSADYAAFYVSPYDLGILSFLRKGRSIQECLSWHEGEDNVLLLLPRDETSEAVSINLGARGFCLHLFGAFQDGPDLMVDLIETTEPLYVQYEPLPELFSTVRSGSIVRFTVNPAEGKVRQVESYPYPELHLDFPVSSPCARAAGTQDIWMLALPVEPRGRTKYFDRLQRFDWARGAVVDEYFPPSGTYLGGEAALAEGAAGERDWLICPVWEAEERSTAILIFAAYDLAAGPIANVPTTVESPLGFHASYDLASSFT